MMVYPPPLFVRGKAPPPVRFRLIVYTIRVPSLTELVHFFKTIL